MIVNQIDYKNQSQAFLIWQKIEKNIEFLLDFKNQNETCLKPYIDSLAYKFFRFSSIIRKIGDFELLEKEIEIKYFYYQILKILPYIETNAPLPRIFLKPIVN